MKAPEASAKRGSKDPGTTTFIQRKQLTVLFADIPGFVAIAAKLDAEEVHEFINALWVKLDAVITRHGGIIDKHIGDAVMALFGAKIATEEDAEHAVRAALEMLLCVADFQPSQESARLQMRVGIHTGLVLLGPIGTTREFTAIGDAVNLASRLEHEAPPGGILISHDTFQQVCGLFEIQVIPPLALKGKEELVQAYRVLQAKPRRLALRTRGIEGVDRQMVGRQKELQKLQEGFRRVVGECRTQAFTILGEPGIGKSCLLQEFQKWMELLPDMVRLFIGRATRETTNVPFALIRDLFWFRFQIQESDSSTVARRKFNAGLRQFLEGAGVHEDVPAIEAQQHALGQLLGLDFWDSPHLRGTILELGQTRRSAFEFLARFFQTISRGTRLPGDVVETRSALLVLEDIHWSDGDSLDLIEYLTRHCREAPLLLVCVARPDLLEHRPWWGKGWPAHEWINLDPLSREDSVRLVETILRKTSRIPKTLPDRVIVKAEGNPFWIEEIIKMLIDEKVIVADLDQWHIKPGALTSTNIPKTLTGVLQARLDGLPATERTVLQRASVVGRTFWDRAVLAMEDTDDSTVRSEAAAKGAVDEIARALAGLQRKDLLFRTDTSAFAEATQHQFKHELLCDVAYESLLKKSRRRYHGRVAEWFIEQSGERVAEFAGVIGTHFEKADRPVEAAEWYGRAGQQARVAYAPAGAIELLQKALRLMPAAGGQERLRKRLEWQQDLAEVLGAQALFQQGIQACLAAQDLAEKIGDYVAQARAWNGLAFLQERLGENLKSIQSAERAEALARQAGESESARTELIRALHLNGWACYRLSDSQRVLSLANQTALLCEQCGDRERLAVSFKLRGVAHLQFGHFAEARRWFEQGLALAQELGDRRNAAAMLSNLGETARLEGDFEAATGLYQRALTLAREIGHRESELIYLSNLAGACLGLRRFNEAEANLREVVASAERPTTWSLAETYRFLSEACLGQGKFPEARDAAQHALDLAERSKNALDLGGAWRALANAAAGLQSTELRASATRRTDPRVCFEESHRVFQRIAAEAEEARTLRAWADYERQAGALADSRRLEEQAREILARLEVANRE